MAKMKHIDSDADALRELARNLGLSSILLDEISDRLEKALRSEIILATLLARLDLGKVECTDTEYNEVVARYGGLHFNTDYDNHLMSVELVQVATSFTQPSDSVN